LFLFNFLLKKSFNTIMHSFVVPWPKIGPNHLTTILQPLCKGTTSLVLDWYLHQKPRCKIIQNHMEL
jgi:hypothetical protein